MDVVDNSLNINVDDLFKDPDDLQGQEEQNDQNLDATKSEDINPSQMTEEVSKRINEVKHKTEIDTQDKIAKELGYESYAELQEANNKKALAAAGLDSEDKDVMAVIDKLVEKRLADDPRMKKLEEIEQQEKTDFVTAQLKEINKFAGTNFTKIEELPQDTLKVWEKTGNLKQAYLATEGEALLLKKNASQLNGSLNHLANPGSSGVGSVTRPLTEDEKAIWRSVMPDITDEELSKKTMNVE